uniref:Prolow-density lipoprotein receptor-related protein 1-like beta-propeller domain-containing protein n=1 Tax=Branchiostoma floridae TaxID=7739 RepID=C3YXV3_BRAFL|eukprot:XP_002598900.1 hypothetical protein BRAFLDRAFT_107340 [Branchiostoma floridae]
MYEQALAEQAGQVQSPLYGHGQTSGPPTQPPPVHQPKGVSDQEQEDQGTTPNTYAEAEIVYYTIKDQDLPQSLRGMGLKQESPQGEVDTSGRSPHQGGSRGRVHHGNGASDESQEEQAGQVQSPLYGHGQTSEPPTQPPPVHQPKGVSDQEQEDQGTSPNTYAEAEKVYYTIKDQDLPPSLRGVGLKQESPQEEMETSGPPPHQGGSRGRVRHGNGASDESQEEQEACTNVYEEVEDMKRCATCTSEDDLRELSTTVEALKRDQDDLWQLSTTVDALKQVEDMCLLCADHSSETIKTTGDNNSDPFLLVADWKGQTILQVDIISGSKVTLPLEGVDQPYALDYDPLTDYVYWSDGGNKKIKRARRDGSGMETIIDTGNNHTINSLGLALDHAGGNIYWSAVGAKTISVAKKDGSSARTLLTSPDIGYPRDLVLDPRNDDQEYGIYSSDLLGNDIREVLYEPGKYVEGIAVDEDFVYWSSEWFDSSSSSSFQGKIGKLSKSDLTKTVLVDGLKYPVGIYLSTAAPPGVINGHVDVIRHDRTTNSDPNISPYAVTHELTMPYKGKAATQSGQGNDTIPPNSDTYMCHALAMKTLSEDTKTVQPNSDTYMCHALAMKTLSEDTKTVQPNSDTYMCHALAMNTLSEDTKTKAPIQKKIVASTSKEDFPVPLAGRDSPENSADAPALSGNGGTMRESPHPPNEASVHMTPLSNFTHEHNPRPSDPELARDASNPVYGHDLDASNPVYGQGQNTDPDTDLRPAGMQPYAVRYQEEDADDDKDHQPANMEPYAVRYQEEDADDDKDHQPANMEPYAVRYQEEDADDDKDHQPAGMEPYAVRYQDEDADDDKDHQPAGMEPYAGRYQDEDADDDNDHRPASMEPYVDPGMTLSLQGKILALQFHERMTGTCAALENTQGVPHGPREAAGGTTPKQQTDFQARADAAASVPNPMYGVRWVMYASRAGTTPKQQTDWQARADAAASIPNPMYASRADRLYPGGASGCRALCSFIRSQLTYISTGIAVLLGLVAVGLVIFIFINNEEISEQTTTVDVQTTTVDALKRDQDNMSTTVDALKRDQDNMSTTVDALKRDQDDMHQLSTTVDALKRDQDDMRQLSTTVDALKSDQDDMRQLSTTVDALKRDLDKERSRIATSEQRLDATIKTPRDHDSRKNSEPFLLVSCPDEETIIQVDITSGSKITLPLVAVGQPYALDYDPLTDYVYWSDYSNYWNGIIKRARRDGSGMETIIDVKGFHAYGLALDHAGGNIYWSVAVPETISVAKMDGSSARTLLTSPAINMPYELVLDPRNGLMYWVDGYNKGRICRAAMDGSNQTTIITGLNKPQAITIDFNEDRLYYRDQEYGIYSSDLQGNDIREVVHEDGKWVLGIAVDEDFVYWSSGWLSKSDLTKTVLVDGLETQGIYLSTAAPPGVTNVHICASNSEAVIFINKIASGRKEAVTFGVTSSGRSNVLSRIFRKRQRLVLADSYTAIHGRWLEGGREGGRIAREGTTNSDPNISPYAVTHELTMPYKGKAATQSGQGNDTIPPNSDTYMCHALAMKTLSEDTKTVQPNSDTYMCHALAMKTLSEDTKTVQPNSDTYMCHALAMNTLSEDTKTKAPIQKKIVASTSKEDFPVPLAGRDSPENSADAPALSGNGGTMRESPHPPNEASVHMTPLSNLTHEHNPRPSDPELARDASNPVYGHDLDASNPVYGQGQGTDPDTDLRPASMEPYAVRYLEEDADDDKDHRPAGMEPYAEISEQTTTVDVQTTTVDALKRDQDNMSTTVDALKRDQDNMSTTVDALKRDQDDMHQLSTTVDALKRDQDDMRQLSTTVDALKSDQDDMRQLSTTVDALKSDQDDMRQLPTTVDALKRDLDKERSRIATSEQRLDATIKTPRDHDSRKNSEPFLLVADRNKETIIQVDITSGSKLTLPLVGVGWPYVLDFDPLTDFVYWSDGWNINIKRARRDGSGMETITDVKRDAYGLALDHAGGNIYWSVYYAKTISVAKKDGSSARTLLTSPAINHPYGLVLDPRNGLMYWVDVSNKGRICRAAMDGSNQTTIITGLNRPSAITIDFTEDRLYYSDQYYIYSSDLLGNDIRQVLYEDGKWVHGIAVDEDFVYWSSRWWYSSSSSSSWGKIGK